MNVIVTAQVNKKVPAISRAVIAIDINDIIHSTIAAGVFLFVARNLTKTGQKLEQWPAESSVLWSVSVSWNKSSSAQAS